MTQLVKNPPAMQETWVQSPGWEESLEKGKTTHYMTEGLSLSFTHSCLRNPMDRGAWWAIVHEVTKESDTI